MASPNLDASTTFESAVEALQHFVLDNHEPGDRLPSEVELAGMLGVSRLTAREAVKVLAGRGLLQVSRGRRAAVRALDSSILSDYLSIALRRDPRGLLELNDVRQSLEILSVGAAARSATPASRAAIDVALSRMADASRLPGAEKGSLEPYHRADLEFHAAIALASGNRMLALLLESLSQCLRESFVASARGHLARGGTVAQDLSAHREIAAAIDRGDPVKAERAMRSHLNQVARDLRLAMHAVGDTSAVPARSPE